MARSPSAEPDEGNHADHIENVVPLTKVNDFPGTGGYLCGRHRSESNRPLVAFLRVALAFASLCLSHGNPLVLSARFPAIVPWASQPALIFVVLST